MKKLFAAVFSALGLYASAAHAAPPAPSVTGLQDYLVPYVGIFDVMDGDNYTQFGIEYRFRDFFYGVRPTLGVNATDDGDVYGYGGFHWEVPLIQNRLLLTPNFAVGAYHHGDGKDLGGAIEFRSGIELAWQFDNSHRVGIAFNHISNAGIYDKNPGAETLLINYAVPISALVKGW